MVGEVWGGDGTDVYCFEGVVFCGSGGVVSEMTLGCDGNEAGGSQWPGSAGAAVAVFVLIGKLAD